MITPKEWLLQGLNAARKRLGEEDVDQQQQLKRIESKLDKLSRDSASRSTKHVEQLDRIESGVQKGNDTLYQLAKRVDRALQPRWRSVIALIGLTVTITIIIMLTIF